MAALGPAERAQLAAMLKDGVYESLAGTMAAAGDGELRARFGDQARTQRAEGAGVPAARAGGAGAGGAGGVAVG